MNLARLIGGLVLSSQVCFGALPVINSQPQNLTVTPGSTAILSVGSSGATSFQWRFNGVDIPGATAATLNVPNSQSANAGYYLVIAKNSDGWVPSQMAYLSVVNFPSFVPFRTQGNTHALANYQNYPIYDVPITNGTATVVAGPVLDQMQVLSGSAPVTNGYLSGTARTLPTVEANANAYYRVDISYQSYSETYTQQSTVLYIPTTGGVATISNLYFPIWLEWPDPNYYPVSPTNQVRIPAEKVSITNQFFNFTDLGIPTYQWRKDGQELGTPTSVNSIVFTNFVLTITNFQAADVGVYDMKVLGNSWFIAPKIYLSIQQSNGPGVFQNPRRNGASFVADLLGAPGRSYKVQWSSNLVNWLDLLTLSNQTGSVPLTTSLGADRRFYRAVLLPQ